MSQIDEMNDAIRLAHQNDWQRAEMFFRMHPAALDSLMIESAQNSGSLMVGSPRPKNFRGIPIEEDTAQRGWQLLARQPK